MRRVLITGISGFAGSHLAERLVNKAEVWGTCLDNNLENISGVPGLKLVQCDLLDPAMIEAALEQARPDTIFHLAGQSVPSLSFGAPAETLRTNIFSTLNLFEAALIRAPEAVILNIGSGDEYGEVSPEELPVKEGTELRPMNPYAVSKVTQDLLAFQYNRSRNLKVVRCRPFNHYGPRQAASLVASAFAKQVAEIEAGIKTEKVLKVGSLDASKDFLYVKDVAAAYELLARKGEPGEVYNICSGSPVKIQTILDTLLSLTNERIEVATDPARLRSKEAPVLYGDAGKLKGLGWAPGYTLDRGLKELLDFWREKVKKG
ncbi:MAG: GDP-mannose 4,6-dehydratase [Deltaproteobacteria bacterium]|nr:GDP-mannose 4,6-dehydratase [Deltaproteobacteria bacterium]